MRHGPGPFAALSLFVVLAASCTALPTVPSNPSLTPTTVPAPTPAATLGQPFALQIGQSVQFADGLAVTFEDVPTDGRCSSCTASYYAQVNLRVSVPGKAAVPVSIKTPPIAQVEGDIAPYRIELVDLEPQRQYPPNTINRADYVVTLKASK